MKLTKTFEVKYEAGHSYPETWVWTEYYCPGCGKQEAWMRDDGGDYYLGELYLCLHCGGNFYLPSGVDTPNEKDWQNTQRIEAFSR